MVGKVVGCIGEMMGDKDALVEVGGVTIDSWGFVVVKDSSRGQPDTVEPCLTVCLTTYLI